MRRKTSPHKKIEDAIGYRFRDSGLLSTALMHRSYRFENEGVTEDNQRLEFLGDAVLGWISAAVLYDMFPGGDEGTLTHMRSRITNGRALARVARDIGLGEELMLGKGEDKSGGRTRESNLADVLEAVIGAAYLDGGSKGVRAVFDKLFAPQLSPEDGDLWMGNPKGKLQEVAQRLWRKNPRYAVLREEGPAHARVYEVAVDLGGSVSGKGEGTNKRDAEARAAMAALRKIRHAYPKAF